MNPLALRQIDEARNLDRGDRIVGQRPGRVTVECGPTLNVGTSARRVQLSEVPEPNTITDVAPKATIPPHSQGILGRAHPRVPPFTAGEQMLFLCMDANKGDYFRTPLILLSRYVRN